MTSTPDKTYPSSLPPGSLGLPLLGETISFLLDPQNFSRKRHKKYGSIFKTHIFGDSAIYVFGGEACRFVLENENKYFQNELPKNTKKLLGQCSLSAQTGALHQNRRNILSKAFSRQYLTQQIQTIEEITQNYFERWENLKDFSWYPELRSYSFDIACKLFVGVDQFSELGNLLKIWSEGLFSFSPPLPWTKFGRALNSRQKILRFIEEIVIGRQQTNTLKEDVLGLLLLDRDREGNPLSTVEIKDQILNLLFAGHETLASALTSFCLLLAKHPDVLEKCRQEQLKLDTSETLSFESLNQMNYLEQVIKEVLRKNPPVGGGFRKVIQDCSFDGYFFPKGWFVIYEISLTHQKPELFFNPEFFDPERFNDANQSHLTSEGYIPFGAGKRRCLGENLANLEMKIFASLLIRSYDWELLPQQNLEIQPSPLPHPIDGLKVNFRRL